MADDQPRLFDFTRPAAGAEEAPLISASNEDAALALAGWRAWPGGALALIGPAGGGKTLFAQAWAREAGAAFAAPHSVAGIESAFRAHGGRLVVDDADFPRDDEALMLALDLARAEGGAILLTARRPPADWPAALPDLRSRFLALPLARIADPDETLLTALLRRLCRKRFMEVRENVARYLAQHMERTYAAAHELVEELDAMLTGGAHPVHYDLAREALARLGRRKSQEASETA